MTCGPPEMNSSSAELRHAPAPPLPLCRNQCAGDRYSPVIVGAGAVVYPVAPGRASAPLKAPELSQQVRLVEQHDGTRVHQRQQFEVVAARRPLALPVRDAMLAEALLDKTRGVLVPLHLPQVVSAQQITRFGDDPGRVEGRSPSSAHIEHAPLPVPMGDPHREAVLAAAGGRIHVPPVATLRLDEASNDSPFGLTAPSAQRAPA